MSGRLVEVEDLASLVGSRHGLCAASFLYSECLALQVPRNIHQFKIELWKLSKFCSAVVELARYKVMEFSPPQSANSLVYMTLHTFTQETRSDALLFTGRRARCTKPHQMFNGLRYVLSAAHAPHLPCGWSRCKDASHSPASKPLGVMNLVLQNCNPRATLMTFELRLPLR